jgi:hypothetical protein
VGEFGEFALESAQEQQGCACRWSDGKEVRPDCGGPGLLQLGDEAAMTAFCHEMIILCPAQVLRTESALKRRMESVPSAAVEVRGARVELISRSENSRAASATRDC